MKSSQAISTLLTFLIFCTTIGAVIATVLFFNEGSFSYDDSTGIITVLGETVEVDPDIVGFVLSLPQRSWNFILSFLPRTLSVAISYVAETFFHSFMRFASDLLDFFIDFIRAGT